MTPGSQTLETVRIPRRFYWLLRLTIAGIAALLLIAALWFYCDRRTDRQFAQRLLAMRAAGEPIGPQDLAPPAIADEENYATLFAQASQALSAAADSPRSSSMTYRGYPPFSDEWYSLARTSLKVNAKALDAFALAAQRSKVDWHLTYSSPMIYILLPHLNQARALANTAADAALLDHLDGDDAAAMEIAFQMQREAEAIDQEPFLVSHLVAVGITALNCANIESFATALEIGTPAQNGRHPVTRQRIAELIALLLRGPKPLRDAMLSEQAMLVDFFLTSASKHVLLRPILRRQVMDETSTWSEMMQALDDPNQRVAQAGLTRLHAGHFPQTMWGSFDRMAVTQNRVRYGMRITAISLACRLFQLDHGRWPVSLAELTPAYLPSVPLDPFAKAGAPIGYKILAGDRPIVFCTDEKDADGSAAAKPNALPRYGWNLPDAQWNDVAARTGPPLATQPTTNAADDSEN